MNRREALKKMALLTGGAVSFSTVSAVMGGCRSTGGSFSPKTLTDHQNDLVVAISELIIPETDTPGAKTAGVNRFVDKMLTDWNTPEEKKHFLAGLDAVDETGIRMHGSPFLELGEEQQVSVLEQKEQEAQEQQLPKTEPSPFFSMMKEFTLAGYYTSEIGATKELEWNHVAGEYDGCYPYSKAGRAWSS